MRAVARKGVSNMVECILGFLRVVAFIVIAGQNGNLTEIAKEVGRRTKKGR